MEPIHIFYKELSTDESNVFTADITEKNEVENVKFKKSLEYTVTGLSINHDTGTDLVIITGVGRQNFLSSAIHKTCKRKKGS